MHVAARLSQKSARAHAARCPSGLNAISTAVLHQELCDCLLGPGVCMYVGGVDPFPRYRLEHHKSLMRETKVGGRGGWGNLECVWYGVPVCVWRFTC